jgi:hypothetical protein
MNLQSLHADSVYHKIYHESCAEFEEVRELCLSEDNWLRRIYTPEFLVLEKHVGYVVMYDKLTHEPVGMAGLFNDGRYPSNIAIHLHRAYLFPKYRQRSLRGIMDMFKMVNTHIVTPLNSIKQFDAYFVTIQSRDKKESSGWWDAYNSAICRASPGFKKGECFIQTCPHDVQKCWQYHLYFEHVPGAWSAWDKRSITEEEWKNLPLGD